MALKFDATVNLGHLLSALLIGMSLIGAYVSLDKRVVVLEVWKAADDVAKSEQKEVIREIRSDIKDVQRSLNDISRAINAPKAH